MVNFIFLEKSEIPYLYIYVFISVALSLIFDIILMYHLIYFLELTLIKTL